ncbi:MAG: hypothetical protein EOP06_32310 [Proteobacteria bacterium]|nr:MAG: hypothetical protein EOP06_32310 [Pseudomonadota bacterium]
MMTRKEARARVAEFSKADRLWRPLAIFAAEVLLWMGALVGVIAFESVSLKVAASLILWIATTQLFIIAHEAGHG